MTKTEGDVTEAAKHLTLLRLARLYRVSPPSPGSSQNIGLKLRMASNNSEDLAPLNSESDTLGSGS